jgi:FKBP-type peptidyl-prolyl cis-trans isomerase
MNRITRVTLLLLVVGLWVTTPHVTDARIKIKKEKAPMALVEAGFTELAGGLQYKDDVVGTGDTAKAGQMVTVHYTGTLTDGSKFDSSKDRGQPFAFALGAGQVIKGWDVGVAGMQVGGTRTLHIPASMGYGERGYPPVIPGNATLNFVVELLGVE